MCRATVAALLTYIEREQVLVALLVVLDPRSSPPWTCGPVEFIGSNKIQCDVRVCVCVCVCVLFVTGFCYLHVTFC